VTTVTQAGGDRGDTMMERSYAVQAQAVRRANRDANRAETRTARRPTTTALPQAPTGPRAAVMRNESDRRGLDQARRETRYTMATIIKLRNKIENVSALKGWRMRWHMQ
jgi:hypothetical protein